MERCGGRVVSKFRLIAQGVDVSRVNAELDAQPELWNARRYRTEAEDSPHRGINDIWVRWRAAEELTSEASHVEPHFSVDWPAWGALPALHPIVRNLSHVVDARVRGGILITETPPGCQVQPHIDRGWHPEFYDTKLYLVLQSDPRCLHYCGGDIENFRAGDVWQYPNNVEHSVVNRGDAAHRNVIICLRTI